MSTLEKRLKYDYRAQYFRRSKGLFGTIWFCSQCGIPLLRHQVQVDHIVPLKSKVGINYHTNTVAICARCNQKKSARVGLVTAKGFAAKIIELILFGLQNLLLSLLVITLKLINALINALFSPIKNSKDWKIKIVVITIYALIIYLVLKRIKL